MRKFGINKTNYPEISTRELLASFGYSKEKSITFIDPPSEQDNNKIKYYKQLLSEDEVLKIPENTYYYSIRQNIFMWVIQFRVPLDLKVQTIQHCFILIDKIAILHPQFFEIEKISELISLTALFISSKYKEIYSPCISDFIYFSKDRFEEVHMIYMERVLIQMLDCRLSYPVVSNFYLYRYQKQPSKHLLTVLTKKEFIGFPKSVLAKAFWLLQNNLHPEKQQDKMQVRIAKMMHLAIHK